MNLKEVRALTISVDHHDVLRLTLPYNLEVFKSVLVLTHPKDQNTISSATECGADLLLTDVMYSRGAIFNKFAALELGMDYLGRQGMVCVMDIDIAVPHSTFFGCRTDSVYVPRRRMLPAEMQKIPEQRKWRQYKYHESDQFGNFCNLFYCEDPVLKAKRRWWPDDWFWTGGGQWCFSDLWPESRRVRTSPQDVLHIGQSGINWAGRVSPYLNGDVHPEAEVRRGNLQQVLQLRNDRGIMDRNETERARC